MTLVPGWIPPSKENWELLLTMWKFYPLFASTQWLVSWYGMGKTSKPSRLNLPGRVAWLTMEAPGFLTLLYIIRTLPAQVGIAELPWQNKVLAGLFVTHYLYRAVLYPYLQPSIAPIHVLVWASALMFQLTNATCLGGWLAAYGRTSEADWAASSASSSFSPPSTPQFAAGVALFLAGLATNYYHDEELRRIRRDEQARQARVAAQGRGDASRHYQIPRAGLFALVLYPHYLAEWAEWAGFWLACGPDCGPAMMFLLNEVAAMLPRAVNGRRWYVGRFGEEKLRGRRAVIPWVW